MLQDAVLFGDIETALQCYNDWKVSDRVRYPFAGGRLDQPDWITHNLDTLALTEQWIELGAELNAKPDVDEWAGLGEP